MNLKTDYLGLKLKNPIIVGASPMAHSLDFARRLEDAGVSAIVMHSLFEEQVPAPSRNQGQANIYGADLRKDAEHFAHSPEAYVAHVERMKASLEIPVIASLNGLNDGGWTGYSQLLQDAGADALELNLYFLPKADDESSAIVEQRAFQVVRMVRQYVSIPVSVKLSPYFTSLPHFAHRIEEAGANGIVLFNRLFQPDIDIKRLKTIPRLDLSSSEDLLLRLRWMAVLHGRLRAKLALSGGVHSVEDLVKAIMAGSDAVQVVSAFLKNGPDYARILIDGLEDWMEANSFENIDQLRGCMSYVHTNEPDVVGRSNYMKIIQSWRPKQSAEF